MRCSAWWFGYRAVELCGVVVCDTVVVWGAVVVHGAVVVWGAVVGYGAAVVWGAALPPGTHHPG